MSKLNNLNTDKFRAIFSNIPVPSTRLDKLEMGVFDNFVRTVTLPDITIETVQSEFKQITIKNPISKFNNDLSPISIDLVCDEDMENYRTLFEWMQELRLGNALQNESTLRESTIKSLRIILKDNQDRSGPTFVLNDLLLVNLSALNLVFGSSEQTIFTATFQCNYYTIERSTTNKNN